MKRPSNNLTQRELQIPELIGQGLTTRQIASNLHISPKTVDTHRANIKRKLNTENSANTVLTAIKKGIIKI